MGRGVSQMRLSQRLSRGQSQRSSLGDVDHTTGLTRQEKNAIIKSWKYVQDDQIPTSTAFFQRLFTEHPEYIQFFPKFRGKELQQVFEMFTLELHAHRVYMALNTLVENLDSPEILENTMQKVGEDHKKTGVPNEAFQALVKVILDVMSEKQGKHFTPLVKSSWVKVFDIVVYTLQKVVNEE
ncbi:globin-like [Argonauta hians]